MYKLKILVSFVAIVSLTIGNGVIPTPAQAAVSTTRNIVFPAIGKVSYSNDFGAPRSGGRTHEGNDIMGAKMTPLVAAVDGTITFVPWPEPSYGYMVSIEDSDGFEYNYIHINNDTPKTDDGVGGGANAYAPYMEQGSKVVRGQLVGYMGDSGNAETTAPHLHFEIRAPDGTALNPYDSLQKSTKINTPVPAKQQANELIPFGEFTGGASIATGNIDSDKTKEIVVGAGPGGGPHVRRYDSIPSSATKNTNIKGDFFAYSPTFTGGIDVAVADVLDDKKEEIVTAPGPGGGPHIKIFDADGKLLKDFFAYPTSFVGGVNVAAADLDGDGKAEIITGPKSKGGPHVKVFKADGSLWKEFMAYSGTFTGGVDVSGVPASSKKNSGLIVTASGSGISPQVKTFTTDGKEKSSFQPYSSGFTGGVRVSVGKIGSSYKIATAPASGGGADFKMFSTTGSSASSYTAFEKWWSGGYDIAVGDKTPIISSSAGNRRATVRPVKSSRSSNNDCGRRCSSDY